MVQGERAMGVPPGADFGGDQRAGERGFAGVGEGDQRDVGRVPAGGEIQAAFLFPA